MNAGVCRDKNCNELFIVPKHLIAHVTFLEDTLQKLQLEIEQRLSPFKEARNLLLSIPGIQAVAASTMLAEIGDDMSLRRNGPAVRAVPWTYHL